MYKDDLTAACAQRDNLTQELKNLQKFIAEREARIEQDLRTLAHLERTIGFLSGTAITLFLVLIIAAIRTCL